MSHADEPKVVITTHNQSGGTNVGGDLNITAAPRPAAIGTFEFQNREMEDGGYLTRALIAVTACYAAKALHVEVHGAAISDLRLRPAPTAQAEATGVDMYSMRNVYRLPEYPHKATVQVGAPLESDYVVEVQTHSPDTLRFGLALDT